MCVLKLKSVIWKTHIQKLRALIKKININACIFDDEGVETPIKSKENVALSLEKKYVRRRSYGGFVERMKSNSIYVVRKAVIR